MFLNYFQKKNNIVGPYTPLIKMLYSECKPLIKNLTFFVSFNEFLAIFKIIFRNENSIVVVTSKVKVLIRLLWIMLKETQTSHVSFTKTKWLKRGEKERVIYRKLEEIFVDILFCKRGRKFCIVSKISRGMLNFIVLNK